jgi:hypothetical protein
VRLVVDANILSSQLLRARGRRLFAHPDLQLFIAERAWSEARHEPRRRVALMGAQGRLAVGTGPELLDAALGLVELRGTRVPDAIFAHLEQAGRRRHTPDVLCRRSTLRSQLRTGDDMLDNAWSFEDSSVGVPQVAS